MSPRHLIPKPRLLLEDELGSWNCCHGGLFRRQSTDFLREIRDLVSVTFPDVS
jgi:hypothetical protein